MNIVKRKLIAIAIAIAFVLGLAVIAGPASAASDASCTNWFSTVSNGIRFSNKNVYGIYKAARKNGGNGTTTDYVFIVNGGTGSQTTSFGDATWLFRVDGAGRVVRLRSRRTGGFSVVERRRLASLDSPTSASTSMAVEFRSVSTTDSSQSRDIDESPRLPASGSSML